MADYKDTVNLPRTAFPMRADLPVREPKQVEAWLQNRIYEKLVEKNQGKEKFTLHDGPPYANGSIHPGHCLNKTLKDIVAKHAAMKGYLSEYVPGWDCHGLPIELKVDKQLGHKKRELSAGEFRRACRKYAEEQVDVQRKEFQRLGILGRWDDPYLTMSFDYEAQTVRELAIIARRGALYRRKRPVHWCFHDVTALAEAEVEYAEKTSPSIYVGFRSGDYVLAIWTTTPWTIPANLAITANPELEYVAYELQGKQVIVAKDLLHGFLRDVAPGELVDPGSVQGDDLVAEARRRAPSLKDPSRVKKSFQGSELSGWEYQHPLLPRKGRVVLGEHATAEAGTGLVHTAPGHGEDDYRMGLQYGLDIYAPVDSYGKFTQDVGIEGLAGVKVFDANPLVIEKLKAAGALFGDALEIKHQYPHCWRCKKPVIFRATDQWWISLDDTGIRKKALAAIDDIDAHGGFIPAWGKERIRGMVENRPDWCISRQRAWGVPIPVVYCAKDRTPVVSAELMEHVAGIFEKEGADAWFDRAVDQLVPAGTSCAKCGGTTFEKETDILDVWFDSGSSFAAVCKSGRWPNLAYPADLYLEGSDQHRGWFNSSLTIGVAADDRAPFKAVLTHGFVVNTDRQKMSKSLGNFTAPSEMFKKYGAEIVRLWVAGSDYRGDVNLSTEILDKLAEGYRKIRNTLRYCLSQLYDFDPRTDASEQFQPIDRWALSRLEHYRTLVLKAYDAYEFHKIFHATVELCATDLSAFYFDVLKDRTYCSGANWPERRAAQTVLWRIVRDLARLLAPIMSFTAEETWQMVPGRAEESVFLAGFPEGNPGAVSESLEEEFDTLRSLRETVNAALEAKRVAKEIGKATEADVILKVPEGLPREVAQRYEAQLADLFLTASVRLEPGEAASAEVRKSPHEGCVRCWRALPEVSQSAEKLCARCQKAVAK